MATRKRPQLRWQPRTMSRHVLVSKRGRRLESLFNEERLFGKNVDLPSSIVVLNAGPDDTDEVSGVETEMLRAECRFLRMERDLALKKLRRRMERILRSALQTLISGRDKLDAGARSSVSESLDDEIEAMRSKLIELQSVTTTTTTSRRTKIFDANLDDNNLLLNQHISREIQQMAGGSFSADEDSVENSSRFVGMELFSMTGRSSVIVSSANSMEMTSIQHEELHQQGEEQPCYGRRCRAVVRRVAEQVRFETEQWSQVQEMLEKVKEEMEQLQASRDKWQHQALFSQDHIFSLNSSVEAWKKRASSEEAKVKDLKTKLHVLQEELKMAREEARRAADSNSLLLLTSSRNQTQAEKQVPTFQQKQKENSNLKNGNNRSQGDLREENKRLQVQKRPPFLDIGNSSPLMRQITKVVFPGHKIFR